MKSSIIFILIINVLFFSCSSEETPRIIPDKLNSIPFVSTDYTGKTISIPVSRDINIASVTLKGGSFWISNITISGKTISFNVLENIYYEKGYRSDSIIITEGEYIIGSFAIYQARNRISPTHLVWAKSSAKYYNQSLNLDGVEFAKYIIKNDDYKLYPALAYCIEMNHDLNNIEWYLPSLNEMQTAEQDLLSTFNKHNYWWSTGNYNSLAHPYSSIHGSVAFYKNEEYWVYSFRTGLKE